MTHSCRRIITTIIFIVALQNISKAQTTLSAGDIAFTGYNSDNLIGLDTFSFVIIRPAGISVTTQISFTDNGWLSATNALATNEGILTWTAGSFIPQGAEIKIAGSTALRNGSVNGSVNVTGTFSLSTTGDQVLAFQGTSTSPLFIAGIHMNVCTVAGDGADSDANNWDGSLVSTNRSALPPGLTTGFTAIWFTTEVDNARYNCTGSNGTQNAVRIAINTPANWSTDDINPYLLPSGCLFFTALLTATQSQIDVACNGFSNASATVVASGGVSPYSYSWAPVGGTASTAGFLAAGTYFCTITDAASTSIVKTFIITEPGDIPGVLAGIAGGGVTSSAHAMGFSSGFYTDGSCNRIARVQASGASPVSGSIETKVWVENTLPTHLGSPYVARHFEITPATNASTSTGTVTLYFLQSEFDAFNAVAANKLPTGPADASGIANLRIGKYSGTSSDNSGAPSSYSSVKDVINPDDAGIIWSATNTRWEVTFDVIGFSGFVVQTSQFTLPVTWASFTAEKTNDKVSLKWQTGSESNTHHFVAEYSTDGSRFTPLGTVPAAGNSNSLRSYSFAHDYPGSDVNYYRILQVDKDGRTTYSVVRKVMLNTVSGFAIITNPVVNHNLHVQFNIAAVACIYNASGKLLSKQQVLPGVQKLDVSRLPAGIYMLLVGHETRKFTIQ